MGFDYSAFDAINLGVGGSEALSLFRQFAVGWHDDEQVDAVKGMEVLVNHVPDSFRGGEGCTGVHCHIFIGEFGTRECCLVGGT